MSARAYSLTLAAAAKRVSDVYGDGASVVNAASDIPYREIKLQAGGSTLYVGSDSTVAAATGFVVLTDQTITLGPYQTGPVKFSNLWVAGAGATLHVLAVPY